MQTTLTNSKSYTETLSIEPFRRIANVTQEYVLTVKSQLHHAKDPSEQRTMHQVIISRDALKDIVINSFSALGN